MTASRLIKFFLAHAFILCLVAHQGSAAGEEPADDPGPEVQLDFTYGQLGPPRQTTEFIAGEWISARVQIKGLSTTRGDNKVHFSIQINVKNEANQVIGNIPSSERHGRLSLGGSTFTRPFLLPVPSDAPAGNYSLEVLVTDRLSHKTMQSVTPFILLPANSFGTQLIYLAKDEEGRIPLYGVLPAGEIIWLHSTITGLEAKDGKASFTNSIDVLNEIQRTIGDEPLESINHKPFHSSDSSIGIRTAYPIQLNTPGRFTLRLNTKDEHSGKEVTHQLPIVVIDNLLELKN